MPERDDKGQFILGHTGLGGRGEGSRNKLGRDFTDKLYEDFKLHGASVIETVRANEPAQYLRVVAGLLPKEVKFESAPLSDMSDDELTRLIDIIRATLPTAAKTGNGSTAPSGPDALH